MKHWQTKVDRVIRGDSALHSQGYRLLYVPMHAEASHGYVYEHRIVAAVKLGRSLRAGEVVHHLNRDKLDNRPENLEVLASQSEHGKAHADVVTDAEIGHLLALGTPAKNLARLGVSRQRLARVRRALIARRIRPLMCAAQHVLTDASTKVSASGAFVCRECQSDRARKRWAA